MCVWDLGSRNKLKGAPRAVWTGLEFVRWCLDSKWLDRGTAARQPASGDASSAEEAEQSPGDEAERAAEAAGREGGGSEDGGGPAAAARAPQAHLRGHRVTDTFEAHRRRFSQSTKRRLLYYKRYVPAGLEGVRLYGVYK